MNNIIEIKDLNYRDLFDNLDISFKENIFYTISGANNSGKTTLIRILNNFANIKGTIYLNNKDITEYKLNELIKLIGIVIPKEVVFIEDNLFKELIYQEIDEELINYILKGLKIKTISKEEIRKLSSKELILIHVAKELARRPKILLLDSISTYLTYKEMQELYKFLRLFQEKYGLTVITTTINLEDALLSDYLYVLYNKDILLEGVPEKVLQMDNILNKIGLSVPFMIDLSVKLKDYDLLKDIEFDKDRMVDILWK